MELTTAARRYLLGVPTVASLVQQRIYKDRLDEAVNGTGRAALVLSRQPGWGGRDPVQTVEFPRLFVDAHVDPTRNDTGEVEVRNGEDRGFALVRAVNRAFTYPTLWGQRMGGFGSRPGLMVVSCQPYVEPRVVEGADVGVKDDDVVIIRTEIALAVAADG